MVKALIFDFDGVLALSEGARFNFLQYLAPRYGITLSENHKRIAYGKTTQNYLEDILPGQDDVIQKMLHDFRNEYIARITDFIEPIPSTTNFIRDYHGDVPIAIASMSSRKTIELFLNHIGIMDKISCIVSRDEVARVKPDPEVYLKAAKELSVAPEHCLAFEDTVLGAQAVLSAGMQCCIILNGVNTREEFDDMNVHFVDSEKALHAIIAS